tara:strand:+ start:1220 stop:1612 length:393 start_codon:yes stop_codon:yes gene_type:complete
MAALSDYAEKLVLDWLMTTGSATRPTTWYIALYTGAPSDSGGGTEVSGNGYARQSVAFDAASSPGGTTVNSADVSFTASGGSFGTVTHLGIFDALTVGNLIWHGSLTASKAIDDGDTLTFTAGNIDLTMA